MPVRITLDVGGAVELDRSLLGMSSRLVDMRPLWRDVTDDLRDLARRNFASEGDTLSGGWAPLASSTLAYKALRGYDLRILHRTHRLRDSLTGRTGDTVQTSRRDELAWGTRVPYARFHRTGTSRMPARPPLELNEARRRELVKRVQRYIVEGSKTRGRL